MNFRQALLRAVLAVAAVMLVLAGPSFGVRQATPSKHGNLRDFVRSGALQKPTAAQRAAVRALHARATWNSYGTPSTLMRPGGFLSKQARGATATIAARSWLAKQKVIFRLDSVSGLRAYADSRLASSSGRTVTFQQSLGGLKIVGGSGFMTVGVQRAKGNRWKIAFVSSTAIGSVPLKGSAKLTAAQGWVHGASNVGLKSALVNVRSAKAARGWTNLRVGGLHDVQRVRLGAFATAHRAVPAFETIVLDTSGAATAAYRVIVDARTGAVLARHNLTDYFSTAKKSKRPLAVTTTPFNGELAATDGACGPRHGPYTVGAGVRALSGFAAATDPLNDVVFFLFLDGSTTPLITADTGFSPEQFRYSPAGGVPPGDYFVQVCDFPDGAAWAAPRTYTGTVTIDDSPAPPAYWARWRAFPANPPLALNAMFPWGHPSTDTRQVWCWRSAPDCDRVVGNLASRSPWDYDARANVTTYTTSGNNNRAATSWTNGTAPSPPQFMPVSNPQRDYSYSWTNNWNTRLCQRATPEVPGSTYDDAAATVNLFAMHNRMHDFSYYLGFTEENWNAQSSNFGLTETWQEGDPLIGDVQSGVAVGSRDNANMSTLPDGASSITNMYMWQPIAGSFYAPCVDGDYDQGVIGHEFGHMIENRMIGKGNVRAGFHAGSMGEAFGDLVSIEYLRENGFTPTDGEDPFVTGAYATGNKEHGIRNYVMNYPRTGAFPTPSTFAHVNPLNFSDIGYDTPGNEVHSDGEIWVAVNNSVRQALIDKYNGAFPAGDGKLQAACAAGELPSQNCPGNRRWIQLVFDAMLLDPTAPTMVDARNSMLAADVMRYGGANQTEIWGAFARRGLGNAAAIHPALGVSDTNPVPDFGSPLENNAQVTFSLVSKETGDPVVGNVYVGHYEKQANPIADTDPATTNSGIDVNRDATAAFAPGEYEFLAVAKGYGFYRFRARFNAGQVKTQTVVMPTNWASSTGGATATGDGTTPGAALDETEATNWSADGRAADGTLSGIAGKQITIDLAGTEARNITDVAVSAMIAPGQGRFAALRSFELWACNAAAGADCSTDAGFTKVYTSAGDAFPGDAPRPNGPHLILRDFKVPKFKATHLRLRVLANQCTGGPAYQGEQDADPTATTDCDTNVSASTAASSRRFVRTAEIQAFSSEPLKD
jgi:extracellular elastinolytic metalloproteinase